MNQVWWESIVSAVVVFYIGETCGLLVSPCNRRGGGTCFKVGAEVGR